MHEVVCHPSLQPDESFIEYRDKIIAVILQNGHSAASHIGSLLRFRRDISTTVFPEYFANRVLVLVPVISSRLHSQIKKALWQL